VLEKDSFSLPVVLDVNDKDGGIKLVVALHAMVMTINHSTEPPTLTLGNAHTNLGDNGLRNRTQHST
jgi:hypothetical protein